MKYRAFDVTASPHGRTKIRVHSARSGVTRLLSYPEARLLLACDTFEKLSDHAVRNARLQEIARSDHEARGGLISHDAVRSTRSGGAIEEPEGETEALTRARQRLEQFVAEGFLVSEADLQSEIAALRGVNADVGAARAGESSKQNGMTAVASIGIPTCDRPELLGRALTSYVENTVRFGRNLEFVVMDDSRAPGTQRLNREAARAAGRRRGVRVRYATRDDRTTYADELANYADVPHDVVRFALLGDERYGMTYGATRNALMLDAVGTATVHTDDDTVCRVTQPPDVRTGLALSSRVDANDLWFFEHHEDALAAASPVEADLCTIHEGLLGKRAFAWTSACESLDVSTVESTFLVRLRTPDARVVLTMLGIAGDSGAPYPYRFLYGGNTFERLVRSELAYRVGMSTRQMMKAVTRPTVSDGAFCMTTHVGLDLRNQLPPFVPVLRNEDGVFGSVIQKCYRGAFTAGLPHMVDHRPPGVRAFSHEAMRHRHRTCLANGLLAWIILTYRDVPDDLPSLGRYLEDLGALSQKSFADILRRIAREATGANLVHARRALRERPDGPSYWTEDVECYLEAAEKAMDDPTYAVPADLEGSAGARLERFRELVRRFGTMLVHWPSVVGAAGALRARGRRPSRPA